VIGTRDGLEPQYLGLPLVLEFGDATVIHRLLEFGFGQLALGGRFVPSLRGYEALLEQLFLTAVLLERVFDPALPGTHRAFELGALQGERRCRALDRGIQLHQHLAFADEIAAIHRDPFNHAFHRTADLHDLARIHHTVELRRCRALRPQYEQASRRPGTRTRSHENGTMVHGCALKADDEATSTRRSASRTL
jgi:hypothetical protein